MNIYSDVIEFSPSTEILVGLFFSSSPLFIYTDISFISFTELFVPLQLMVVRLNYS